MRVTAVLEDWEVIDSGQSVNYSQELGHGSYGSVYKGKYVLGDCSEIDVAVKRIDKENINLLESEILAKVGSHRNVLGFYCSKKKRKTAVNSGSSN